MKKHNTPEAIQPSNTRLNIKPAILSIVSQSRTYATRLLEFLNFRENTHNADHKTPTPLNTSDQAGVEELQENSAEKRKSEIEDFSMDNSSFYSVFKSLATFATLANDLFGENEYYFDESTKKTLAAAWKQKLVDSVIPALEDLSVENCNDTNLCATIISNLTSLGKRAEDGEKIRIENVIQKFRKRKSNLNAAQDGVRRNEKINANGENSVNEVSSSGAPHSSSPENSNTLVDVAVAHSQGKSFRQIEEAHKKEPANPAYWLTYFDEFDPNKTNDKEKKKKSKKQQEKMLLNLLKKSSSVSSKDKQKILEVIAEDAERIAKQSFKKFRKNLKLINSDHLKATQQNILQLQKNAKKFLALKQFIPNEQEIAEYIPLAYRIINNDFLERQFIEKQRGKGTPPEHGQNALNPHFYHSGPSNITSSHFLNPDNPEDNEKPKEKLLAEELDKTMKIWEKKVKKFQSTIKAKNFIPVADIEILRNEIKNWDLEKVFNPLFGQESNQSLNFKKSNSYKNWETQKNSLLDLIDALEKY